MGPVWRTVLSSDEARPALPARPDATREVDSVYGTQYRRETVSGPGPLLRARGCWAHVAYQAAACGGGTRGLRSTLAGAVGSVDARWGTPAGGKVNASDDGAGA
jgi:hypothetical protein